MSTDRYFEITGGSRVAVLDRETVRATALDLIRKSALDVPEISAALDAANGLNRETFEAANDLEIIQSVLGRVVGSRRLAIIAPNIQENFERRLEDIRREAVRDDLKDDPSAGELTSSTFFIEGRCKGFIDDIIQEAKIKQDKFPQG